MAQKTIQVSALVRSTSGYAIYDLSSCAPFEIKSASAMEGTKKYSAQSISTDEYGLPRICLRPDESSYLDESSANYFKIQYRDSSGNTKFTVPQIADIVIETAPYLIEDSPLYYHAYLHNEVPILGSTSQDKYKELPLLLSDYGYSQDFAENEQEFLRGGGNNNLWPTPLTAGYLRSNRELNLCDASAPFLLPYLTQINTFMFRTVYPNNTQHQRFFTVEATEQPDMNADPPMLGEDDWLFFDKLSDSSFKLTRTGSHWDSSESIDIPSRSIIIDIQGHGGRGAAGYKGSNESGSKLGVAGGGGGGSGAFISIQSNLQTMLIIEQPTRSNLIQLMYKDADGVTRTLLKVHAGGAGKSASWTAKGVALSGGNGGEGGIIELYDTQGNIVPVTSKLSRDNINEIITDMNVMLAPLGICILDLLFGVAGGAGGSKYSESTSTLNGEQPGHEGSMLNIDPIFLRTSDNSYSWTSTAASDGGAGRPTGGKGPSSSGKTAGKTSGWAGGGGGAASVFANGGSYSQSRASYGSGGYGGSAGWDASIGTTYGIQGGPGYIAIYY